jgi:hypothetical protein
VENIEFAGRKKLKMTSTNRLRSNSSYPLMLKGKKGRAVQSYLVSINNHRKTAGYKIAVLIARSAVALLPAEWDAS